MINRHPILSAIPIDEDSAHPYFARLPSINLEEAVTFLIRRDPLQGKNEADIELDALLQNQHNLSFKARYGEMPFWRLIILMNPRPMTGSGVEFTASFMFHHALGDGGSGMIFHKHFLSALLSNSPPLTITTIPSPNSQSHPTSSSCTQPLYPLDSYPRPRRPLVRQQDLRPNDFTIPIPHHPRIDNKSLPRRMPCQQDNYYSHHPRTHRLGPFLHPP